MTAQPTRDQLRALTDKAARGPWTVDDGGGYDFSVTQGEDGDYIACDVTPRDAAFIAAARTAVPRLLDQLDQAEAELDSWMTRAYEAEGKLWKAEAIIRRQERYIEGLECADAVGLKARAETAEARIKAVRDVLDNPIHLVGWDDPLVPAAHVRRALEG